MPIGHLWPVDKRGVRLVIRDLRQRIDLLPIGEAGIDELHRGVHAGDRGDDLVAIVRFAACRQIASEPESHLRFDAEDALRLGGKASRPRQHCEDRCIGRLCIGARRSRLPTLDGAEAKRDRILDRVGLFGVARTAIGGKLDAPLARVACLDEQRRSA